MRICAHARWLLLLVGVVGCPAAPEASAPTTVDLTGTEKPPATVVAGRDTSVISEDPRPSTPAAADRDGDGVRDADDRCPDEPEDRDGFEDADGCPDRDNDRDGVLDVSDLCPNEPEIDDGRHDGGGCPVSSEAHKR